MSMATGVVANISPCRAAQCAAYACARIPPVGIRRSAVGADSKVRRLLHVPSSAMADDTPGARRSLHVQAQSSYRRQLGWKPKKSGPGFGYKRFEYGLEWYPTKDALLLANPGPVLVGTAYEYLDSHARALGRSGLQSARKYGSFQSHWEFWNVINDHLEEERPQNLHEVLPMNEPRCLYFDLDGDVAHQSSHLEIITWLKTFVRWVFSGDRLGWDPGFPDPVVLTSADPFKYSCHVVFPQIQFASYEVQKAYMSVILDALPSLTVELGDGQSVPILDRLVDRVPYSPFQLFRGPYACKLAGGKFLPETQLEPECFFKSDPLACFASHVDADYKLEIPNVRQMLEWNEELRHYHHEQKKRIAPALRSPGTVSPQDLANLYLLDFQQLGTSGVLDFTGKSELEQYEIGLQHIHPARASQWWSWFRLSGVTYTVLQRYVGDPVATRRIWQAHHKWSCTYPYFDEMENVEMVLRCEGRRVSGLPLLWKLVEFDNPGIEVRRPSFTNVAR